MKSLQNVITKARSSGTANYSWEYKHWHWIQLTSDFFTLFGKLADTKLQLAKVHFDFI